MTPEGFWSRVVKTDGCWTWTGATDPTGYGRARYQTERGSGNYAHRAAYIEVRGEVPAGLQLDHLCRVRNCVNPDHLEAVTAAENTRRSPIHVGALASPLACPRGHAYPTPGRGQTCLECNRSRNRAWRRTDAYRQWRRTYTGRAA